MTALLTPPPAVTSATTSPQPRKWTRAEYYQLADLGFFQGQRAELIGGDIMVFSPQNWPHSSTTDRAGRILRAACGSSVWVRTQLPLQLGQTSDPESDVSVVPGQPEDYTNHPTAALLIVEVSDTTLAFDRRVKGSLYAAANIADYWIVNINDRQLEVYRDPRPNAALPFGAGYAAPLIFRAGDSVTPLALPNATIAVAALLG
jgi:Uma2 family endonuclease